MGKRGPQPTDMQRLLRWERDWTYVLRILRDGVPGGRKDVGHIKAPPAPIVWEVKDLSEVVARHDIWESLIGARSVKDVRLACVQWKSKLRAVVTDRDRPSQLTGYIGLTKFPDLLNQYAVEFLATVRDKRFPRAAYSDESRLKHLARGLAGAIMGLRPATAIDRLRKMKHGPDGPLWNRDEKRCLCWHCSSGNYFGYNVAAVQKEKK